MRTLRFIVEGQIIKRDPECDFTNLVPGTEEYLQAEFAFSPEWEGYAKAASFWSIMGKEYTPKVLEGGKTCMIPAEALSHRSFKIQVVGRSTTSKLTTNKIQITQDGGV
jgi:hypothetical protein